MATHLLTKDRTCPHTWTQTTNIKLTSLKYSLPQILTSTIKWRTTSSLCSWARIIYRKMAATGTIISFRTIVVMPTLSSSPKTKKDSWPQTAGKCRASTKRTSNRSDGTLVKLTCSDSQRIPRSYPPRWSTPPTARKNLSWWWGSVVRIPRTRRISQ